MARGPLTAAYLAPYPRNGYVLARGLFDGREISALRRAAKEDKAPSTTTRSAGPTARAASFGCPSGTTPGTGSTACSHAAGSVVDTCDLLLEDEVYHYHSKMIMKEAHELRLVLD